MLPIAGHHLGPSTSGYHSRKPYPTRVNRVVTAVLSVPEPNKHLLCTLVDAPHSLDLSISFRNILLIDAICINPKSSCAGCFGASTFGKHFAPTSNFGN